MLERAVIVGGPRHGYAYLVSEKEKVLRIPVIEGKLIDWDGDTPIYPDGHIKIVECAIVRKKDRQTVIIWPKEAE